LTTYAITRPIRFGSGFAGVTAVHVGIVPDHGLSVVTDICCGAAPVVVPVQPVLFASILGFTETMVREQGIMNIDTGQWSCHWVGYWVVDTGGTITLHNGNPLSSATMDYSVSGFQILYEEMPQ
jgi:hypothetical protein